MYEIFHIGLECWVLKETLMWNYVIPFGSRIARIQGQCSAAPVAGWRHDDGVVRQALVWMLPHSGRSQPPAGINWTMKPPESKAFSHIDSHLMCVICKVAGGGTMHYSFDCDYRHAPRSVEGNVVRINVDTVSHKGDANRTRWDVSKDPMDAIDFELQCYVTIVR